ncbi:MAG TPA: diacylglycerol kinase family protein [Polyangiales bacterium]
MSGLDSEAQSNLSALDRVAVVVNGRARQVTAEIVEVLDQIVQTGDLFVSRDLAEAERIAHTIAERRYPTVLTGGGDGTFVQMVTRVVRACEKRGQPPPRFGLLKLGTGNALSWVLGNDQTASNKAVVADLARLRSEGGSRSLKLLEVEGMLTPFAGLGVDAICLEHYGATKDWLSQSKLTRPLATGPSAYALSVVTRSLPEFLLRSHPHVKVVNEGAACMRMGADDKPSLEIPQGAVLYEGPSRLVAMSTIPYWGFGARIFPFADERDDRFSLRICDIGSIEVAAHIRSIWRGGYRNERTVHDFLCERIAIHYQMPMSLQIGGDVVGRRTLVRAALAAPIEVVDYYAPPPVRAN